MIRLSGKINIQQHKKNRYILYTVVDENSMVIQTFVIQMKCIIQNHVAWKVTGGYVPIPSRLAICELITKC